MRYNKKINRQPLKFGLWYSLGGHALLILVLGYIAYTAPRTVVSEGDPTIRAIMIDPRVFAAPPVTTAIHGTTSVKKVQTFNRKLLVDQIAQLKSRAHLKSQEKRTRHLKQDVTALQRSKQVRSATLSDHTQFAENPSPIRRIQPEYPMRAQAMGIEGKVVVHYDIDAYGHVINIKIVEAKPNAIFNQAVKRAMRHWKYEAHPVKNLIITIIFKQDSSIIIKET